MDLTVSPGLCESLDEEVSKRPCALHCAKISKNMNLQTRVNINICLYG